MQRSLNHLPGRTRLLVLGLVCGLALPLGANAQAAPPKAAQWFPDNTAVFVSVPSVPEFKTAYMSTSAGHLVRDPKMSAFGTDLWSRLMTAAEKLEERLGVSIEEILAIPQGELSIALVADKDQDPALVVLLETEDHMDAVETLLARAGEFMERRNGQKSEEDILGTTLVSYARQGDRARELAHFTRDNLIVFGSDVEVVRGILERSSGGIATPPLADNSKFKVVREHFHNLQTEDAEFLWFADPIQLLRGIAVRRPEAQLTLALLPAIGLDGLRAVGGAQKMNVPPLDSVSEMHVLLDQPRTGVLELIALEPGDATPEPFVPAGVSNYWTLRWKLPKSYDKLVELVDSFQGEGAFQRQVADRFKKNTDIDLRDEFVAGATGRVSYITQVLFSDVVNPQATALAVEMKDAATARELLERVADHHPDNLERKSLGTREYYRIKLNGPQEPPPNVRLPTPSFAAVEQYLVVTDSTEMIQEMLSVLDGVQPALRDDLEYKLVQSKTRELSGRHTPGAFFFTRPSESIKMMLNIVDNPMARESIQQAAENRPVMRAINESLEAHELPAAEDLERYFAPSGGFIVDDQTGLHLISFSLRRELD